MNGSVISAEAFVEHKRKIAKIGSLDIMSV